MYVYSHMPAIVSRFVSSQSLQEDCFAAASLCYSCCCCCVPERICSDFVMRFESVSPSLRLCMCERVYMLRCLVAKIIAKDCENLKLMSVRPSVVRSSLLFSGLSVCLALAFV